MSWSMILKLPCSHFFCQYGECPQWATGCTENRDTLEILTPTAALLGASDATPLTGFAVWHNLVLSTSLLALKSLFISWTLNHCASYCTYIYIARRISTQRSCCQYSPGSGCNFCALFWVQGAAKCNLLQSVIWPFSRSLENTEATP